MTREEFHKTYWNYYLVLEERFNNVLRYIELSEDNFSTYSYEFVNQLQAIVSEVDVIMKQICGFLQKENKGINDYKGVILSKYSDITDQEVKISNITIKPFDNWQNEPLFWWKEYNKVKHGRANNFKLANMKNIINALAALYILEMNYLKDITSLNQDVDIPDKVSSLFTLVNWNNRYTSLANSIGCLYENSLSIITNS